MFLSVLASSISIISVIGAPAGIMGASTCLAFSIISGFIKKFLKTIRDKKKKKIKVLC